MAELNELTINGSNYTFEDDVARSLATTEASRAQAAEQSLQTAINNKVDKVTGKGLSTNDYTNDEKAKLAGLNNYDDTQVRQLIAQTNANFANYYTKAESYSATEVDTLLRTQRQGQFVVVNTLPTPSADTMFKIYLVPSTYPETQNVKDEFVTLENNGTYSWEQIGTTAVDLSGYSTTAEMNAAIANALASYYTKSEVDEALGGKQNTIDDLANIRSGAQAGSTAVQPSTLNNTVKNMVAESGVYDVSANNDNTKFESLRALLSSANLNTLIPTDIRKGGMSIKFVQSSDNKYVQYRCIANEFTTDVIKWAVCDDSVYVGSPEYIRVYTDESKKILWAIKADGTIFYGAGVPQQVIDYVNGKIIELGLDNYETVVDFLGTLIDGDKTLQQLLYAKVDKVEGKSLIQTDVAENTEYRECPEWIDVIVDNVKKIIVGIDKDGKVKVFTGLDIPTINAENATFGNVTFVGDIPQQVKDYVDAAVLAPNIDEINHVKSLGTPITLMDYTYVYPNGDIEAKYNFINILRKSSDLIYMYYGVSDRNRPIATSTYMKLAYCDLSLGEVTNPNSWHRELPSGLTKTPSQKWQEWYNQQTIIPVTFDTDAATTRLNIPENERYSNMFITYNNGTETIVEHYGYKTPPEGASWNDTITPTDSRTWNDIFASDDYWPKVENLYNNSNYLYFEDLYGDPLLVCYGGSVIKVPDAEYPYRAIELGGMPLFKGCAIAHAGIYMWKSKDGVIFEQCKFIGVKKKNSGDTDERFERDGTVEAILRGNIIRIYTRWRPYPFTKRQIGEVDIDIDGNVLSPGHHLFGEDNLYIAGSSILDIRRDILFPTYIETGILPEAVKCYIRDGNRVTEVQLPDDFSESQALKQVYVGNNAIISIQKDEDFKQYIVYNAATFLHDRGPHTQDFDYNSNNAYIKIREIKLDV